MRLVFAGTPEVAVVSLQALLKSHHEVVAVLTRPDAVAGRGHRLTPVRSAGSRRSTAFPPSSRHDPVTRTSSRRWPTAARLLSGRCLRRAHPAGSLGHPAKGWVNLHFSLLPAWRGAAPVQRAVMAGDDLTGAAVFQLEAGMDTGPVFGVVTEAIGAVTPPGPAGPTRPLGCRAAGPGP